MTAPRNRTYIGIDISKATLDVSAPGVQLKVTNDRVGFREMLKATRQVRFKHFICEPTGIYGRELVAYLRSRRIRVTIVDAYRTRQFARATGRWAKTDPIDAALLASYGTTLQPPASPALDVRWVPHVEAVRFRRQLEQHLRALDRQRLGLHRPENTAAINAVRDVIAGEIKACGSRISAYVAATPRLAELNRRLRLVVGVRQRAAENLTADLPELGRVDRKQIAALAGLAPYNRDSGTVTGPAGRHIQRGRPWPRSTLYMCALVASAHNRILKAYYERLVASGKPRKVALIAVARKLLVYLNYLACDSYKSQLPAQGPLRKTGSYWTEAERQRLHLLRQGGASCKIIALELGRKEASVHKQIYSEQLRASGRQKRRVFAKPETLVWTAPGTRKAKD